MGAKETRWLHSLSPVPAEHHVTERYPSFNAFQDKLMSDAPMDSVESVDSANVTDLAPENDTSLSPGDDSEQQVKLVSASQPILSNQHPLPSSPTQPPPVYPSTVAVPTTTTSTTTWIPFILELVNLVE